MNPTKQQLCIYASGNKETNVLQSATKQRKSFKNSIICIEDLSNELLYEIFDYLDGCHLYESFLNLNSRFQKLLIHSSLPLKMSLSTNNRMILEHIHINIINPNKSRLVSLHLSNMIATQSFLKLSIINSLFNRLQSLVINGIEAYKFQLLLLQLATLPRLYSLIVCLIGQFETFAPIFELIFRLPLLKYNKLSYGPWRVSSTLPLAICEQFSSIEYLNIDIEITVRELITILSYTPQLRRLTCINLLNSNLYFVGEKKITLLNLTHINMDRCRLQFDEFEMFIKKIDCQLQVLRFTTYENITFLNAERWEELILQYIPHLRKFEFEYEEKISQNFQLILYHQQISRFMSSFWVERQWHFEVETNAPFCTNGQIIYLIRSYRKKWYHLYENKENDAHSKQDNSSSLKQHDLVPSTQETLNSFVEVLQDIELIATNRCDFERYQLFVKNISPIFQLIRITCLNINLSYSSADLLVNFIHHLPNLDSLHMSCLPLLKLDASSNQQAKFYSVSNNNKITKVNLEKMIQLEQVQFLINLCPQMEYLQVGCTSHVNVEFLVRFISIKHITKYIIHLRSLCLHISTADDKMIQELQNIINLEKLLSDYSIKRIFDKIYFQWK